MKARKRLIGEQTQERADIIRHEDELRQMLDAYKTIICTHDIKFDVDTDEYDGIPEIDIVNDIWNELFEMCSYAYRFELKHKKDEVNDNINKLKSELDEFYGKDPEKDSPASVCKIMDFGCGRSEELQKLYEWKENELKKLARYAEMINEFYE